MPQNSTPPPMMKTNGPPRFRAKGRYCLGRALLVVVDFLEVGVDDIVVRLRLPAPSAAASAAAPSACCALYMASPSFIEAWARVLVLALMSSASSPLTASFSAAMAASMAVFSAGADLVAMLGHRLFGRMDQRVGLVLGFDQLAALLVFGGMGFGFLDHLLDVGVRQAARGLDADLLFLAGRLVLGGDADDAVGVDVEGDFDLRHAARRGRNALQVEAAQRSCCPPPFRVRPGTR